jgi:hypothetical protein
MSRVGSKVFPTGMAPSVPPPNCRWDAIFSIQNASSVGTSRKIPITAYPEHSLGLPGE